MVAQWSRVEIESALATDRTIDIVTTGARSGLPRTTEIWFTNVSGRVIICGTPSADGSGERVARRDWLANLRKHPQFVFRLKESILVDLPAEAEVIRDPNERLTVMLAPETQWYRDHAESVEALVRDSPIVAVRFAGSYAWLNNRTTR